MEIKKSPIDYVDEYKKLVKEYRDYKYQLVELKKKRAYAWPKLREENKSEASAEREWGRSEDGLKEMIIRANIDVVEAKMRESWLRIEVIRDEIKFGLKEF